MGKTLETIKSHLKGKKTRDLEARLAKIEDKAIVAHNKLQSYMQMDKKTLSSYVDVMQSMDDFRRNPLISTESFDDIGYYNSLKDAARYDKKVAHMLDALRSKLKGMGIDIDEMQSAPMLEADFSAWAEKINQYLLHTPSGNVTLNDYVEIKDMVDALQKAGNKATNSVIVPMKLALEKKHLSIFDVIRYKDPVGEAHLAQTKEYEQEVNKGMHRAISYMCGIANPEPYKKLYDPYGNRAYIVGRPNHAQEDEYMRLYDTMRYAIKPTIDMLYNTPIHSLDVTKYPAIEDLVNYGVAWARENETPTNN